MACVYIFPFMHTIINLVKASSFRSSNIKAYLHCKTIFHHKVALDV